MIHTYMYTYRSEGVELAVDKPQIELRPNEDGGVREYRLKSLAGALKLLVYETLSY